MLVRSALAVILSLGLGQLVSAADWPQWRGPNRNGTAAAAPALAEAWPKEGPKKLWQSEPMPAGQEGGFGSVTVAGDRAFVYVNWRFSVPVPFRVVREGTVRNLGWIPERMSPDLTKAVEQARLSEERAALKQEEVKPWVDKWIAEHLLTEADKKFAGFVHGRLSKAKDAIALDVLDKIATIREKELPNQEALDNWFANSGIDQGVREQIMKQVETSRAFAKDAVVCLDVKTGQTLWKAEFPGRVYGWGSSSSPCVVGNRLYVAGSSDAYCLDASSGKEIWRTWLPGGEISSSFVTVDNMAIVLSGVLCALDASTGQRLWTQDKVRGTNSSPVAWVKDGKPHVIVNAGGDTVCVDAKTGECLWTVPAGGSGTIAVEGDFAVVFAERADAGLVGYKLSPTAAEKAWTVPVRDRGASPIISNGHVFTVGGGKALCVKLDSGQVVWEQGSPGEICSPILADGKIIAFTGGGLALFRASTEKFEELARVRIPFARCSSPSFADGKLYVRLNDSVACYDLTSVANPAPEKATGQ
jgi:hypothetical protein